MTITNDGRDEVVLLSAEEYERLRRIERRVMHVLELSDDELSAIERIDIPVEAARHDHEMT